MTPKCRKDNTTENVRGAPNAQQHRQLEAGWHNARKERELSERLGLRHATALWPAFERVCHFLFSWKKWLSIARIIGPLTS